MLVVGGVTGVTGLWIDFCFLWTDGSRGCGRCWAGGDGAGCVDEQGECPFTALDG